MFFDISDIAKKKLKKIINVFVFELMKHYFEILDFLQKTKIIVLEKKDNNHTYDNYAF